MSTLRANTLSDVAGTNSPDVTRGEFCRSRFWLNGTGTIAALDTFNCSSFTDNASGDYSVTFSNAFPNAVYSSLIVGDNLTSGFIGFSSDGNAVRTATAQRFGLVNSAIARADGYVQGAIFGDKS